MIGCKVRVSSARFLLIWVGFLLKSALAVADGLPASDSSSSPIVASVNGIAITADEVELIRSFKRSEVYHYFHRTYGIVDPKDFWDPTTRYGTDSPLTASKYLALHELIQIQRQLILGNQLGLIPQRSVMAVMELQRLVNEERNRKRARNQRFYGPGQFTQLAFLEHFLKLLDLRIEVELQRKPELLTDPSDLGSEKRKRVTLYNTSGPFLTESLYDLSRYGDVHILPAFYQLGSQD